MPVHRSSLRGALAAGAIAAGIAIAPTAAIATVPLDPVVHPEGTLKLTDRELVPGSRVQIGGEKFAHGATLELVLIGLAGRFPLGEVTADSVGGFNRSFPIPVDLDIGTYRLVAIAADGDEVASLNVQLLAAAPEPEEDVGAGESGGHSEDGAHAEGAEPTGEPLALDRARSPWVTGGALVGIIFALVAGGLLLRKHPQDAV